MFYLTTHSTRLYGVRHMVKDHSDSERGNLLPPHGLLIPISSKGSFICIIPQKGWHIPQPLLHVVDHWLEREIAQWVILQIKLNFISTNKTPLKTENVSGLKIPWGKTRTSCESLKKNCISMWSPFISLLLS